jgi:hypothetical protein
VRSSVADEWILSICAKCGVTPESRSEPTVSISHFYWEESRYCSIFCRWAMHRVVTSIHDPESHGPQTFANHGKKEVEMDAEKKGCCARAAGWGLVGIVIAFMWGIGNLATGMGLLKAFGIPLLLMSAIVGIVVLAALNVPWFNRFCSCSSSNDHDLLKPYRHN